MARKAAEANSNTPKPEHVQEAVKKIEDKLSDLLREKGVYMQRCKRIREGIADEYEIAEQLGINKKLLKGIIKERGLERKITEISTSLEADERSEREMLMELLGEFADTELGKAALAAANGGEAQAQAGA